MLPWIDRTDVTYKRKSERRSHTVLLWIDGEGEERGGGGIVGGGRVKAKSHIPTQCSGSYDSFNISCTKCSNLSSRYGGRHFGGLG